MFVLCARIHLQGQHTHTYYNQSRYLDQSTSRPTKLETNGNGRQKKIFKNISWKKILGRYIFDKRIIRNRERERMVTLIITYQIWTMSLAGSKFKKIKQAKHTNNRLVARIELVLTDQQ